MKSLKNENLEDSLEKLAQKAHLSFRNIKYSLKKGSKKEILRGCSGEARPGRFLAVIGSSGCGKSSLMNVLAGNLRNNRKYKIRGEIRINGEKNMGNKVFRQSIAYVLQDEMLSEHLTTREEIELSAGLRLLRPAEERQRLAQKLIESLKLERCADTKIGGRSKSVSGGELRRICIAKEMVTNPPLFLLDEPTSGLDSYSSLCIARLLKDLAEAGRTVIATLHQPSFAMFELFDDLMVMSAGRVVYCGPAECAIATFEGLGHPLPPKSNPVDHFIVTCSLEEAEGIKRADYLAESHGKVLESLRPQPLGIEPPPLAYEKNKRPGFFRQAFYLSRRSVKGIYREPLSRIPRLIQIFYFSIIIGFASRNIEYSTQEGIFRRLILLYALTHLHLNSMYDAIYMNWLEMALLEHESMKRMYSPAAYFVSKLLVECAVDSLLATMYLLNIYFLAGFGRTVGQFAVMWTVFNLAAFIGFASGTVMVFGSPTYEFSSFAATFYMISAIGLAFFPLFMLKPPTTTMTVAFFFNILNVLIDLSIYSELNVRGIYKSCFGDVCKLISVKKSLKIQNLTHVKPTIWFVVAFVTLFVNLAGAFMCIVIKSLRNSSRPLKDKEESVSENE